MKDFIKGMCSLFTWFPVKAPKVPTAKETHEQIVKQLRKDARNLQKDFKQASIKMFGTKTKKK